MNNGGIAIKIYPKNIFKDWDNSFEMSFEKISTKLIENKGETTSPRTTNPPETNKTISIKSKSKVSISFHSNFFKDIAFHNIFKLRIAPANIVNNGINLIANNFKNNWW